MSGFEYKNNILQISKSPEAILSYYFEWADWLNAETGDQIESAVYSVQARANDPNPLTISASGVIDTRTFATLTNGQSDKTYTVNVEITTTNGLIDSRFFRVNVQHRSA